MFSLVPGNHLAPVVEENWGKNDLSMWGQVMGRLPDVAEILLALIIVKSVMVSINPQLDPQGNRPGEELPTRVKGRITKWVSKRDGAEPSVSNRSSGFGTMDILLDRLHTPSHNGIRLVQTILRQVCE